MTRVVEFLKQSLLGIVVGALMLPGAIAAATVFLFLTSPAGGASSAQWDSPLNRTAARCCLFGSLIAIAFWIVLGVGVCRRFSRADSACPTAYDQIRQGLDQVKQRLQDGGRVLATPVLPPAYVQATEHVAHLDGIFRRRSQAGLPWLLGTGYIDAWRRLHAIDEAVLFLEPVPLVLLDAFSDEMRLEGSSIPQSAALLKRLRLAVLSISSKAAHYLSEAPPRGDVTDEDAARAALVQVRLAITEFRDSRREGLVRARNRLFATVIFAGITGCVLLYVAILSGAPKSSIAAVAAFYLVGGVVGLVRQLQAASASEAAAQDDYGLGLVRLIQTPLFSGLAAVGGVVLVKLAQGEGAGSAQSFSLSQTFDLGANPYGLVAAGFFGLTPALLLAGLQQRIDQYKTDLSKSGSSQSQPPG
jgi:hypothetical protein